MHGITITITVPSSIRWSLSVLHNSLGITTKISLLLTILVSFGLHKKQGYGPRERLNFHLFFTSYDQNFWNHEAWLVFMYNVHIINHQGVVLLTHLIFMSLYATLPFDWILIYNYRVSGCKLSLELKLPSIEMLNVESGLSCYQLS